MHNVHPCKCCMNYILRVFFTSCSTDMYLRHHQKSFCREQWNMITFVITAIYLTTKWQISTKGSSCFFFLLNYVKLPFLQQKLLFQSCVQTSCNRFKFSKFIFKVVLLLLQAQWLLREHRERIWAFLHCINFFLFNSFRKKAKVSLPSWAFLLITLFFSLPFSFVYVQLIVWGIKLWSFLPSEI